MKVLGKDGSVKTRNKKKVDEAGYTHAVCKKTGEILPLEDFRVHNTGYYLGYSRKWEREQARKRNQKTSKKGIDTLISIETPKGKKYKAFKKPIPGGRMATHPDSNEILYFEPNVTRDQVRSAFRAYTGVPTTGIKAPKV